MRPLLLVGLVLAGLGACDDDDEPASAPPPPEAPSEPEPAPATGPARIPPPIVQRLDPPAEATAIAPSLTVDARNGTALLTWLEPAGEGHRVRLSRLEGLAWSDPRTVVEGPELVSNWADFPQVAVAATGAVYVSYPQKSSDESPYAYDVRLASSIDGGEHFELLGAVHDDGTPTEHGFVSMVPEADGVRLFWLDGRETGHEGPMGLRTAVSGAVGGSSEVLDARTCDCCQTGATVTPSGPLVVYRDRSEDEVRDVYAIRRRGDAWSAPVAVHADGFRIEGCPVNGPRVAFADGDVVAAWFTGVEQGLVQVARSTDGGERFGAHTTLDGARPVGRVDVAALADGAVAVSWLARVSEEEAEVRLARVDRSGAPGTARVLGRTSASRTSGFPRLARVGDTTLIAWVEAGAAPGLRVASVPDALLTGRGREAPPAPAAVAAPSRTTAGLVGRAGGPSEPLAAALGERAGVVSFFASWCRPCREELALAERLRLAHPEVAVFAVSVDQEGEAAAATARDFGFGGDVLEDRGAGGAFGVPPLPATFVFDRAGSLAFESVGDLGALERGLPAAVARVGGAAGSAPE